MRRLVLLWSLALALPSLVQADSISRYVTNPVLKTVLSTELNGLAPNVDSPQSGFVDNTLTSPATEGQGYLLCEFELSATFGTTAVPANPIPGTAPVLWILKCPDGTNCEPAPTASVKLGRRPDVTFPVVAGQPFTRVVQEIRCPAGVWRAVLTNDGTGVQMKGDGNTVKVRWITIKALEE